MIKYMAKHKLIINELFKINKYGNITIDLNKN